MVQVKRLGQLLHTLARISVEFGSGCYATNLIFPVQDASNQAHGVQVVFRDTSKKTLQLFLKLVDLFHNPLPIKFQILEFRALERRLVLFNSSLGFLEFKFERMADSDKIL